MISFINVVDYLCHENMFSIFQSTHKTEDEQAVSHFRLWQFCVYRAIAQRSRTPSCRFALRSGQEGNV